MNFTRLSQKLRKRASSDPLGAQERTEAKQVARPSKRNLQFDLFAQLSYMAAVATAGVSRRELFDYASQLPYASSHYFNDVSVLAKKMNIDYAEGCRLVAANAKSPEVRSLLLRMAGAFSSGEDEAQFLRREAEIIGEAYGNRYERDVETMKKWTDAYVTLLVASGLIVVVAVISMMIYEVGVFVIVGLALMMVGSTCLGAWILYASAPREIKTRVSGPSSKLQLLAAGLFRIEAPLALATASVMLLLGVDLGWVLITGGLLVLPAGFVANMDDKRVAQLDMDVSTMVRVLGGMTAAIGSTITESILRVDHRSMGSLKPEITRLSQRLSAGIDPSLCWDALVDECGSELVARTVQMFYHPLSLGGEPASVGNASAYYSSRIAFLRATRSMVATTFRWLTLPMHLAMVGLLEFIVEIMRIFATSFAQTDLASSSVSGEFGSLSGADLLSFGQVDIGMVNLLVTFVVLVLTAVNAIAPKAADGGHSLKVVYNLSVMMFITGALMLVIPVFANSLFGSILNG